MNELELFIREWKRTNAIVAKLYENEHNIVFQIKHSYEYRYNKFYTEPVYAAFEKKTGKNTIMCLNYRETLEKAKEEE